MPSIKDKQIECYIPTPTGLKPVYKDNIVTTYYQGRDKEPITIKGKHAIN